MTSFEVDPERHAAAREYLKRGGFEPDLRLQDATAGLAELEDGSFDLAFIDGPKAGYETHLDEAVRLLRPQRTAARRQRPHGRRRRDRRARQPVGPGVGRPDPRLQPAASRITTTCARPSSRSETAWPWRCGDKVEAALIDHVNNLKLQYLVELSKLGDTCADLETDGLDAGCREHDVVFAGQTIPFVLMPHFVSPGQVRRVKHAVTVLCKVLDRFCDAYPTDPALRDELQLSDSEDSLIRIDPGFPRPMRICRLDAFLQGYDVKFLEFNADSPAGVGYTDILFQGLRTTIDLPRVRQEFDTAYTPILPELITTLREAYAHVRASRTGLPETPRLALVDAEGSPSRSPSSASSAPPPRPRASRPTTPRSRTSPTTAARCTSRASRSSSSTAARCWRTSTSPTSSPPRATAASASSTRSARASPTTRSCSRSSRTRASPT